MKKRTMAALISAAAVCTVFSAAHAFTAADTCNGKGYHKQNALRIVRNTVSMPNGSDAALALTEETANWQAHTSFTVDAVLTSNSGTINIGDGLSDFVRTTSVGTQGNRGLTQYRGMGLCTPFVTDPFYTEADTHILDTFTFENPDESWWGVNDVTGRVVMEHEIGHMLGLGDALGIFNIMRTDGYEGTPHNPFIGGNNSHVDVLGDDVNGLYNLGYLARGGANLFASAQKLDGNNFAVTANPNTTLNWCRGSAGSISIAFSPGNNGTQTVTFNQRLALTSVGPTDYAGGTTLGFWDGVTLSPRRETTHVVSFAFPVALPTGFYWLTHFVDDTHSIAEDRETDNFVHEILTIQVIDC